MRIPFSSIIGCQLNASDGRIGQVVDLYVENNNPQWIIRYLIVRMRSWFSRSVLLPAYYAGAADLKSRTISAAMTRLQLRLLPAKESRKNNARQALHFQAPETTALGNEHDPSHKTFRALDDESSLRSGRELLNGYVLRARHSRAAFVNDLIVNDVAWSVPYIVVRTSALSTGKVVLLPSAHIRKICPDKKEFVSDLPRYLIEEAPNYRQGIHVPFEYEQAVQMHYGQPTHAETMRFGVSAGTTRRDWTVFSSDPGGFGPIRIASSA